MTELGMVKEVRPLQSKKAWSPMLVTSLPNTISWIDSILLNQFPIFSQWKITEVKRLQPEKAELLIEVTLLGMVMEVRPQQFLKASAPIVCTLLGMLTVFNPLQPENAPSTMVDTPSVNVISSMDVLFWKYGVTFLQLSTSSFTFEIFNCTPIFNTDRSHETDKNDMLLQP